MRASAFGLTRVKEVVSKVLISMNARETCILCFVAGLTFEIRSDAPGGKERSFQEKFSSVLH